MKKLYAFLLPFLLITTIVSGQTRFWVGPNNGNWNNSANWSATSGGAGGAGVPGASNDVIFNSDALVNIDLSSITLNSLQVTNNKNVRLYTASNTSITVNSSSTTTPGLR